MRNLASKGVPLESVKLIEKVLPKLKAKKEYLNLAIPMSKLITSLESSLDRKNAKQ